MEIHGYTESGSIDATIDGQRLTIPDVAGNRHRQMIAEWEAEGNTIPAYVPPPDPSPLDQTLTKRQVNTALILSGNTDPDGFIEAAIATIADDTQRALALNDWRYAPYYERNHPLFNDPAMLAATNMTAQQVDDLWALATQQLA